MEPLVKTMVPEPDPMIDYNALERKILSMSAHDLIMSMVNGLRDPKTLIDMGSYGYMSEGVCFGCAATNAVLHIMNANVQEIRSHVVYVSFYDFSHTNNDNSTLFVFERAIDMLRRGRLEPYNEKIHPLGFPYITPMPGQKLPWLENDYTEDELQEYEKLSKYQLTVS